jgi:hypothetical protein
VVGAAICGAIGGAPAGPQPDKIEEVITSLAPQIDLLVVWRIAAFAAKKFAGGVPTVFPGGNMTGITSEATTKTNGKTLQILKEIVPNLKRAAVLRAVHEPNGVWMTALDLAARELGVTLVPVVTGPHAG